ncbi:MAG: hypothetical protein HXS50_01420 [Theionarchaea archaeon]|nr:hypothetical protein [Theionarchaea archaeon]
MLLIGEVYPQECPLPLLFDNDPIYNYISIRTREGPAGQLTEEMKRRYVKLYFPRTEEELRKYSFIFYIDADVSVFSGPQSQLMYDSISDGVAGSFFTFGPEFGSVASSILGTMVPHDMSKEISMDWTRRHYRVRFVKGLPPVFTPFAELGVENAIGIGCGFLAPRDGTTAWGILVPESYGPWILEWNYGGSGGNCWAVADDLDHSWWGNIHASIHGLSENPWAMDIMSNIILYSAGRELPENVVIVALARDGFWEYRTERGIVLSLMDWVEKFGASTAHFSVKLVDIDVHWTSASDHYLDGDYDAALAELNEGKSRAQSLREEVLDAKDLVLFWVYMIEYLVITGTSVASGSILWTLMIRQELYRSARTTRFLRD